MEKALVQNFNIKISTIQSCNRFIVDGVNQI